VTDGVRHCGTHHEIAPAIIAAMVTSVARSVARELADSDFASSFVRTFWMARGWKRAPDDAELLNAIRQADYVVMSNGVAAPAARQHKWPAIFDTVTAVLPQPGGIIADRAVLAAVPQLGEIDVRCVLSTPAEAGHIVSDQADD
jgi:hypothetical protein